MASEHRAEEVDDGPLADQQKVSIARAEADAGPPSSSSPPAPVPEINISSFAFPEKASETDREEVIRQVLAACTSVGFMNVVGHGVPQPIIGGLLATLSEFFTSPVEQKEKCVSSPQNLIHRGYTYYQEESTNALFNRPGPRDLREAFSFGPADHQNGRPFGSNTYPDFIPDFRPCIDAYYAEMERLEKVMLEIFTLALARATRQALDPGYLQQQIQPNRGLVKAVWYPACEPSAGDVHLEAHSDWGSFTILLTTAPGLEVCVKSEEGVAQWRSVPVIPGAFTINVADQLACWSNDRFVSCVHRVANIASNQPRLSVPYFSMNILPLDSVETDEKKVACICAPGERPKYEPISVRAYLKRNFEMLKVTDKK
ncbi:unnamed protein product [Polarella glacialis]|uniref:Fe2OG dioxygenase domain-containing protein n=1 Tax=Polarella glacialis TaxID=89957 RepID=A0A813EKV8_POLGL|nr:unnamed protein product [Polarella glacialis]CAE8720208.1 unnamed protein product [Polarella glacialis]CAE8741878.1 unnamed protein product [Polarella glacialis]